MNRACNTIQFANSILGETIDQVVKKGLCTSCGTCVSICPRSAITTSACNPSGVYLPKIDATKCNNCSLCFQVCPGLYVNFEKLNDTIFSKQPNTPEQILLGNYLNCYSGFSLSPRIRFDSSSGGVVTQLLIFALEEGLIDGALVTRMKPGSPLEPDSFIARSPEEIIESSKSKYCPTRANIALSEILKIDGRYAVVGLPCHIHGIRKAQLLNEKLKKRIVLIIGLCCSHYDNFFFFSYLANKLGINSHDIIRLSFRGKGWPGIFSIELKSGRVIEIPLSGWIKYHEDCFFVPDRCLVCCDFGAELADLSCADAWLPEFKNDRIGRSFVISRNMIGENLLQAAISKNKIFLEPINSSRMAKSFGNVHFKKNGISVRSYLFRLQGKEIPTYNTRFLKPNIFDIPRSLIIYFNQKIASKWYLYPALKYLVNFQVNLNKLYKRALSDDFANH